MTRTDRLIVRGMWALPLIAVLLSILGHATGTTWPGKALFWVIIAWPPSLLLILGIPRVLKRRQPARRAEPTLPRMVMPTARTLAFLALYGILGWIVLVTMAGLVQTGDPEKVAAGWALIGLYAAPGILCFLAVLWFPAVTQLRALVGAKKDYHRGLIHVMKERPDEAVVASTRYQQQHPEDPRGCEGLALALLSARRYTEALENADRAVQLGLRWEGLLIRGQILLNLGAVEEATSDLEGSLELKPGIPVTEACLGTALVELRRLDAALTVLERSKKRSRPALSFLALGQAFRLRGMAEAAFKAYQEAARRASAELAAGLAPNRGLLACALAEVGKLGEAERAIRSALAKDASDTVALYAQALVQKQQDDLAGLESTLERMLAVSPNEVVSTLADPDFTPLLVGERFRRLLGRALGEREHILQRVRDRWHRDHESAP